MIKFEIILGDAMVGILEAECLPRAGEEIQTVWGNWMVIRVSHDFLKTRQRTCVHVLECQKAPDKATDELLF